MNDKQTCHKGGENVPLFNSVKAARDEQALSQTELGKRCGVSRQTISSIERGDYHPSVVLAIKIATIFNKTVEELFWYREDENEKL